MKYKHIDKVPQLVFSYENMRLFKLIPPAEQGIAWRAMMDYFDAARDRNADETRPDAPVFQSEIARDFYESITEAIEKDCLRYWKKCEINLKNRGNYIEGLTSGRPMVDEWSTNGDQGSTKADQYNTIQSNPMQSNPKPAPLTPPQSAAEVAEYAKEKQIGIGRQEAERFFEIFSRQGWNDRNGKPIANWHVLLFSWAREQSAVTAQQYAQREYSEEELTNIDELIEEARAMR